MIHYKVDDPVFGPVVILCPRAPLKEAAVAAVRWCNQADVPVFSKSSLLP